MRCKVGVMTAEGNVHVRQKHHVDDRWSQQISEMLVFDPT